MLGFISISTLRVSAASLFLSVSDLHEHGSEVRFAVLGGLWLSLDCFLGCSEALIASSWHEEFAK